jgi:hypothetical protein
MRSPAMRPTAIMPCFNAYSQYTGVRDQEGKGAGGHIPDAPDSRPYAPKLKALLAEHLSRQTTPVDA